MHHAKLLISTTLALPLLLALAPSRDSLAFQPAEGLSLSKQFRVASEMVMENMSVNMNGEEMPAEMMPQDMTMTSDMLAQVTDSYGPTEEGRPARLQRSYDELSMVIGFQGSMPPPMGEMDEEFDSSSELEGLGVVFAWDEEEEGFSPSFDQDSEDADEELLEGLSEDMDLRAFLPEKSVSEGDSWSIDLDGLINVLAPGGNLKIVPEDVAGFASTGMGPGSDFAGMANMVDTLEGSAVATYEGQRDADGSPVGVVSIRLAVSGASDVTDELMSSMEDSELEGMGDIEMDVSAADMEVAFEGTGELLWNIEGGHVHSAELSLEIEMIMDVALSLSMMGQEMDMEQTMEMSGTSEIEVTLVPSDG